MRKRLRHGRILKLVVEHEVHSQDELRSLLRQHNVRVTQATLSRDVHELGLVKTARGYRPLAAAAQEEPAAAPVPAPLDRAVAEFLLEVRSAQNLLVLKTPPGSAAVLASALDAQHWKEIVGTIAGDDTILVITSSRSAAHAVAQRIAELTR